MSIESSIEKRIQEAIARGDFDDLAGKGKPINLDTYFNTPEELRMAFSILKSNDFVPEEVSLLNDLAALKEKIQNTTEEEELQALKKAFSEKNLELRLMLERHNRRR